jgi:hypothetical protein
MKDTIRKQLDQYAVPAISEYDPDLNVVWFIPRKVNIRKTKNDKMYYVLEVIDSNNVLTQIRCWGVRPEKDHIQVNRPYMAKLDYNTQWGFSTRSIHHNFRAL